MTLNVIEKVWCYIIQYYYNSENLNHKKKVVTSYIYSVGVLNSIFAVTHETGNALAIIFLLPVADSRGRKFMAVYLR